MPELRERLRLDLADPLARDAELEPDLLERPRVTVEEPEPELDHLLLADRERVQDRADLLLQHREARRVDRVDRRGILDHVPGVRALVLPPRALEGNRP